MKSDMSEMLATINRLMPDPKPAVSPRDKHVANLRRSIADTGEGDEALADAIRRCDADIAAAQDAEAELTRLESSLAEAHAAAYLAGRSADVRKIEFAIETQRNKLRPLKAKATGASAARNELVARHAAQSQLVGRLQHQLALTGAAGLDAYRAASAVHNQEMREAAVAQRKAVADAETAKRRQADEERQRRQRQDRYGARPQDRGGDYELPACMRDMK